MSDLDTALSSVLPFSELSEAERRAVGQNAIRRRLARDQTVAASGEAWPHLFLLTEGVLDAVKESPAGRSLIVVSIRPGEVFWGPAFFEEGAPNLATLVAREESELVLWSRSDLLPLFQENGQAAWAICRLLIARMARASDVVESLAFQPVAGRLARRLLEHFEEAGEDRMTRTLTLDELAAWAGTTREMACRTLYRFSDQGLIEITRTEFTLTDRTGLSRLATSP